MSWDDNSGGKGRNPWGNNNPSNGGKKNPWGGNGGDNRGGSRGPTEPPDLDDFFAKLQEGFKDFLPPSAGGGGKFIALGVIVVAGLWLASGFYTVNPGEHAVIQRFGAWNRTIDTEGLKYRLPAPVETLPS